MKNKKSEIINQENLPVPCFAAVHYRDKPHFFNFKSDPRKMYWRHSDFSHTLTPDELAVYKVWPHTEDYDRASEIEIEFYKLFRDTPPEKPSLVEGWLSPSGEFWQCGGREHDLLAASLCAVKYNHINDPVDTLESEGWARVHDTHLYVREGLTLDQVRFFKKALKKKVTPYYQKLKEFVARMLEDLKSNQDG